MDYVLVIMFGVVLVLLAALGAVGCHLFPNWDEKVANIMTTITFLIFLSSLLWHIKKQRDRS